MKPTLQEIGLAVTLLAVGALIGAILIINFTIDHCDKFDRNTIVCEVTK